MCRVHFFCMLVVALSCGAAAETLTRERIETNWLRQDEVRGIPVAGGPVTAEEDAAGGCDGVREGSFGFHTAREDQPWWQVDLKRSWPLDQVLIYNRCDEHSERAARLVVLVSDDAKK